MLQCCLLSIRPHPIPRAGLSFLHCCNSWFQPCQSRLGTTLHQKYSTSQVAPNALELVPPDKHRRGFGGKVVLPSEGVLRQPVVSGDGDPVDFTLRAYHVGSRVHIGQVLARLRDLYPNCRTTSGRDYAIIWLSDVINDGSSSSPMFAGRQEAPYLQLLRSLLKPGQLPAALGLRRILKKNPQLDYVIVPQLPQSWPSLLFPASARQQQQQQQQQQVVPAQQQPPAKHLQETQASEADDPAQVQPNRSPTAGSSEQPLQLPVMALYRSGAVVFAGMEQNLELLWLGNLVPPSVRYVPPSVHYTEKSPTAAVPAAVDVEPKEVQKVVVDATCQEHAELGDDEVRLRVLDVGGVRTLTSVLAQSAALSYYEKSVQSALERLADWRLAQSSTPRTGGFSSVLSRHQDKVLFKVIAASALVINEAQQLLEMAEPAWQYDSYNRIWEVMASNYQLQTRLEALELKLHQAETEAKHDVKARAGRRSRKLEQSLVWLLVVSCVLVALEVGRKASMLRATYSSNADSRQTDVDDDDITAQVTDHR